MMKWKVLLFIILMKLNLLADYPSLMGQEITKGGEAFD